MKAYGSENMKWFWRDEEYGPSTKNRPNCRDRREWRRKLHKRARANSREDLFNQKMGL